MIRFVLTAILLGSSAFARNEGVKPGFSFTHDNTTYTVNLLNDPEGLQIRYKNKNLMFPGAVYYLERPAESRPRHLDVLAPDRQIEGRASNVFMAVVGSNVIVFAPDQIQVFPFRIFEKLRLGDPNVEIYGHSRLSRDGWQTYSFLKLIGPGWDHAFLFHSNRGALGLKDPQNTLTTDDVRQDAFLNAHTFKLGGSAYYIEPIEVKALDGETFSYNPLGESDSAPYDALDLLNNPKIKEIKVQSFDKEISLDQFVKERLHVITEAEGSYQQEYEYFKDSISKSIDALLMHKGGGVRVTGRPGTGKSHFARTLVSYILSRPVAKRLHDRIYIEISAADLVSGRGTIGPTEAKIDALKKLSAVVPVVLILDEMHTLVGAGSHRDNQNDFFQYIKSELAEGRIKIIGTTTDLEWKQFFSHDRAMLERFPVHVNIEEPSPEKLLPIMQNFASQHPAFRSVKISQPALQKIIQLATHFDPIGANPRKAIRLLDFALAHAENHGLSEITPENLDEIASALYNFDLQQLQPDMIRKNLTQLEAFMNQRLIGLQAAKQKVILAASDYFLNNIERDNTKPKSILLYGNKGTGKTTFVKSFADGLNFGFTRISMGRYQSPSDVEAFKTAVAQAIQSKPFHAILLDEIEKADPRVQQGALEILDAGRFQAQLAKTHMGLGNLTDIDASKAIFFAATNAGSSAISDIAGIADFEKAAEADGLDRFVLDRFDTYIGIPNPNQHQIHDILVSKWSIVKDVFKKSGREISADPNEIAQYLTRSIEKNYDTQKSLGFQTADSGDNSQLKSVRVLERELKELSERISFFVINNPSEKQISVSVVGGKIVIAGRETSCVNLFNLANSLIR